MAVGDGTTMRECIDFVNESGLGSIGTPDDAVAQIERLVKQSNGGFGAYLQLAHDWAAPAAKFRSYELFARHVAPQFQGQAYSTLDVQGARRAARPVLAESNIKAVEAVTAKYAGRAGRQVDGLTHGGCLGHRVGGRSFVSRALHRSSAGAETRTGSAAGSRWGWSLRCRAAERAFDRLGRRDTERGRSSAGGHVGGPGEPVTRWPVLVR